MKTKLTKLTFENWAGLQSGRISTIHGANGTSVRFVRQKDEGSVFIMENRKGEKHTLLAVATDEERLNAHFKGFQETSL